MKTCLVMGYMNRNLGDDLFFRILFKRYPKVKFYFYPPSTLLKKYKKIFRKYRNVVFYDKEGYYISQRKEYADESIPINLFPMICERAKKVDFYVNIGGSIFIQDENWKNEDRIKLKEIIGSKPSFILGCNFGPGNKEFYKFYHEYFKQYQDICFRDKVSYNMFKDLDNTRKADDIVLLGSDKRLLLSRRNNQSVGISVIDVTNRKDLKDYKEDYYDFLKQSIIFFQNQNFKINLFSFCEADGDLKAIEELLERVDDKRNINVINYNDNIDSFLAKWQENEYIISTRFHAAILALKYKQSFIPLVYSDKTKNFLKDIDGRINSYDIKKLKNAKIEKMTFKKVKKEYTAEKQFEVLDKFLKG